MRVSALLWSTLVRLSFVALGLVVVGAASPVPASDRAVPTRMAVLSDAERVQLGFEGEPEGWGTDDYEVTVISWHQFKDIWSNYDVTWSSGHGYVYTTGEALVAPLNTSEIPLGAGIAKVTLYCEDSSSSGNITLYMTRYWVDTGNGENPGADILWSMSTSGTPGNTALSKTLAWPYINRFDVDNDNLTEDVNYAFVVSVDSDASSRLKVRSMRILWVRQISPAPGSASFNDVPTNHWAFRHIQALYSSGITSGCGGGAFCPDANVTRAQMAVFLAKALGLQFTYYNQDQW